MNKTFKVMGKTLYLQSMIVGAVLISVACALPVVGDYADKMFTMIRDTVGGFFKKK